MNTYVTYTHVCMYDIYLKCLKNKTLFILNFFLACIYVNVCMIPSLDITTSTITNITKYICVCVYISLNVLVMPYFVEIMYRIRKIHYFLLYNIL